MKKTPILIAITLSGLLAVSSLFSANSNGSISVRVAAYNVEFGKNASPEEIGRMFKPYNLDIIGFNEVPDGDWTARVGKGLGMKYTYVGKISSANHKDKYKSILSRTPLQSTVEHELTVERKRSWNPASVVQAVTQDKRHSISFYSLHICRSTDSHNTGHAYRLANEILPKDKTDRIIVLGDFNNEMGDHALKKIEQAGMRATWRGSQNRCFQRIYLQCTGSHKEQRSD